MNTPSTTNTEFVFKNEFHLLKHPFYQAWMEGTLSKEMLQDYAQQYYHHVDAFPRYIENALKLCTDLKTQKILEENLAEENGEAFGTSHPELWLRFAEGLGVSRESVTAAPKRKGIQNVVGAFTGYSLESLPEALGSLYAYESQVPEIAESKIEGLKKHYHIEDERTLSFFEVHKTADVFHRESLLQIIESLPTLEKQKAQRAADKTSRALWDFLSDVYQPHGSACN